MKKLIALLLIIAMLCPFAACGNKKENTTETSFTEPETKETESEKAPESEKASEKETETAPILTETENETETETESETETETETETESESETQTEKEEDPSPASNWEGAAGCYFGDNDVTLEVVLRGTVDNRAYDLIFFAYEDGRETEIFSIENASRVNGNELRASKNGVNYLLIYQPDDELPRIRVKRENSAGSADLDGLYTIVMG